MIEVQSIARPSRDELVGILRAEIVHDGKAASMSGTDVVKHVQARFRQENHRELSPGEIELFRVKDWPARAAERLAERDAAAGAVAANSQ